MARKVMRAVDGNLRGKTVAVLGLTFKPNTDDMREAPSLSLITALQDLGAKIRVYDPEGMEQAKKVLDNVTYCDDPYTCAEDAVAIAIVTEWEQFRALDFARLKKVMESAGAGRPPQRLPAGGNGPPRLQIRQRGPGGLGDRSLRLGTKSVTIAGLDSAIQGLFDKVDPRSARR